MKTQVTKGFEHKGVMYGWIGDDLYRLPQSINERFYGLKKLDLKEVGLKTGYIVRGQLKSLSQLESMAREIKFTVHTFNY